MLLIKDFLFCILLSMKKVSFFFLITLLLACSPKGPQTFDNPYVGKTKSEIISTRGKPAEIKVYDDVEVYIYKRREECFRKAPSSDKEKDLTPYRVYSIEQIYYVNSDDVIYKYQVWRKRID